MKTYHCECYGPKGLGWPTYSATVKAPSVREAKCIATRLALACGWPSIRKVETREMAAVEVGIENT